MSNKEMLERVKAFGMTNQIITEEIQSIGLKFSHDFGHTPASTVDIETIYYPQFTASVRAEASLMRSHL
jgi:hypothetical protein